MPAFIIDQNGTRCIEFRPGQLLSDILRHAGHPPPSACAGSGACGLCVVRIDEGTVSDPTEIERREMTPEQLGAGYRYACQTRLLGDSRIIAEYPPMPSDWHTLTPEERSPFSPPESGGTGQQPGGFRYGAAVDLGTTQLRLELWDVGRRRRLGGVTALNPQTAFGANVLTRLAEAGHSQARAEELGQLVRTAIGEALAAVARREHLSLHLIRDMIFVGNTAMLSLFAGINYDRLLQPGQWTREIACSSAHSAAWVRDWGLADTARVEIVQPLGGFVGSDLLANVLATGLTERPPGSILVDFGTNTEVALWDGRQTWVTSTPGGCAFEGYGAIPARAGAVYRVAKSGSDGAPSLAVIGEARPRGMCGSGLVDFIAMLLEEGRLSRQGRFQGTIPDEGIALSPTLPGITLRRSSIDAFQRGKAAMAAAVHFLLRQAGLKLVDIPHFFVSGAFGQFLKIETAQRVGLLPSIPARRFELAGNSALAGCEHLLLSPSSRETLEEIRRKSVVFNLGENPEFEDLFIDNLYLQPMVEHP